MEPGRSYACSNAFAGQMMLSRYPIEIDGEFWSLRSKIKATPFELTPFDPEKDWNGKDIWIHRGGGFGDLLLTTPLIRELWNRWPDCKISVACGSTYFPLFAGLPVNIETIPIPYEKAIKIEGFLNFEELIEGNPKAANMHMAQLFASEAGIELTDLKPSYKVYDSEREWAWKTYPKVNGLPRIGIQLMASAFMRTYPQMAQVMTELAKSAQVFMLGAPGQVVLEKPVENIVNLMDDKLIFRQSVAVLSTCDVCVSPDSAMIHVASALDIPCVALYGPFPSKYRITSPLAYVFEGRAPCAPCFFHAESPAQFPMGMPCHEKRMCVAMESISKEGVVEKTLSLANLAHSPPLLVV